MEKSKLDAKKLILGIAGIVVGIIIAFIPDPEGLAQPAMAILGILVWAIFFWIGGVLPEAVTAMVMSTLFVLVGIKEVGIAQAFNAFSGATIWLVIGAIGIGICMKQCGLLERVSLLLLKLFPKSFFGRSLGLFISTFIVGPFIPSTMAKTGILSPIVRGISENAGYKDESKPATGLFMAYWASLKSCSTMFITASVVSVALVGMLPADVAAEFGIARWALCTIPVVVPALILMFVFIVMYYGKGQGKKSQADSKAEAASATKDYIEQRLEEMGKWTKKEVIMAIIVVVVVIVWLTKSMTGIPEWAATLVALALGFLFKVVDIKTFRTQTSWETIIFVGCAISIANVFSAAGINAWLTSALGPVTGGFFANPFILVIGVAVFTYLVRFVIVSESGFLAIATAVLFPLSLAAGVNPWVVAVVLNAFTNTFQIPYQSSLLIGTVGVMGEGFIKYSETSKFNVVFCIAMLIGCLIAVPVWMGMGIFYI